MPRLGTPPARPLLPLVRPWSGGGSSSVWALVTWLSKQQGKCCPPALRRRLGVALPSQAPWCPRLGSVPDAMFSWGRLAVLPTAAAAANFPVPAVQPGPFRGGVPPAGTSCRREEVCLPPSHRCPVPLPSRVESLEALPVLSRNPSRSTDRDWETASAASSLASVAEYTGDSLALGARRPAASCGDSAAWEGRARPWSGAPLPLPRSWLTVCPGHVGTPRC